MSGKFRADLNFRDYYLLLYQHKFLILFTAFCFLLPTWYFLSRIPDSYDAYSQLAIEETKESVFLLNPNVNKKNIGYYMGIFQGRAFQETLLNSLPDSLVPGINFSEKIEFLAVSLSINQGTFSSFIKIKSRTESPDLSYQLVKVATDSLVTFCKRVENQEAMETIKAIREHIQRTTEEYNNTLQKKNEVVQNETQGDIQGLTALQSEYEKQLVAFELKHAELKGKEAYFESLDQQIKPLRKKPSEIRIKLQEELANLNKERRKRIQLGLPLSPDDSLSRRITTVEEKIHSMSKGGNKSQDLDLITKWKASKKELSEATAEIQFKKKEIQAFKRAIEDFKKDHPNIINHELQLNRLNEMLARYENDHKRLTEKLEEELIKMRSQTGGLTLVEPPFLPTNPIKRSDYMYYILSLILGLGVGVGLALIRTFIDDSIKSGEDIEKHMALPLLGTIPHIMIRKNDLLIRRGTEKNKRELAFRYPELILKGGKTDEGIITESYRSLRTNLLYASPDNPLQCFVVTSCGPHEGKSLTAANTALAFSQQGDPTLLVDADLRRPIAHYLFSVKRSPGLGDLVTGDRDLQEVVRHIPETSLDVLTAGAYLPNPAELLGSRKFQQIVTKMRKHYKYVIFDTPPIIAVTDSCILSSKVDGVVIVTRAGKTGLHVLERAVQSLEKVSANIYGCVLNDVSLTKNHGYYGYYKAYNHYYRTIKD